MNRFSEKTWKEARQKSLERNAVKALAINLIIIMFIMVGVLSHIAGKAIDDAEVPEIYDCETNYSVKIKVEEVKEVEGVDTTDPENIFPESETEALETEYSKFTYSKDWSADDSYLLAKIAMAEAEGCDVETKALVIIVVLNRVWNDDFPDTIHDVIFEERRGVYQFSPIMEGGRWWTTEPNEECWEAVEMVMNSQYDFSEGALYFETCINENNWHSRNLEYLYESGDIRFYK